MSNRTITALYESKAAAEDGRQRLFNSGISASSINIHDAASTGADGKKDEGFFAGIANMFGSHEDSHTYAEGMKRGNFLLTASVDEASTDAAIQVLEGTKAVDVDEKRAEWAKEEGYGRPTSPSTPQGSDADRSIPIVEERMVVGKREVERGSVRVRSYVVETPVSQQVTLQDETVDVQRRAVNRKPAEGEDLFQERTIEMRETGEEAVVGKEAFVTEELVVSKVAGEHTQEVTDTVRQTKVDVERLPAGSAPQGTTPNPDRR